MYNIVLFPDSPVIQWVTVKYFSCYSVELVIRFEATSGISLGCRKIFLTGTSVRYPPLPDITVGWNVSTGGHAVYHHVQLWRHRHSQHRGQLGVSVADQPAEPTGAHKGTARQHRWHDPPSGLDLPKVSLMEKELMLLLLEHRISCSLCACVWKGSWEGWDGGTYFRETLHQFGAGESSQSRPGLAAAGQPEGSCVSLITTIIHHTRYTLRGKKIIA